jgi:hypothetical protein
MLQVDVLQFPLVLGIVPLVLVVLICWTEGFQGGGADERSASARDFPAQEASCGMPSTAYSAVALPEPLVRRWNGAHFGGNHWETMAAPSGLVGGDDVWVLWRYSDREPPIRLRLRHQTRHAQFRLPRLGPVSLN